MNILYITYFFLSSGGGEVVFYNLAKQMLLLGHNVDVLCQLVSNNTDDEFDRVNVHTIKPRVEYKGTLPVSMMQNIRFIINAIKKGSNIIKYKKIDIIHTNSFSPHIVGSILSKIHKIPVVATIHDVYTDMNWKEWTQENSLSAIFSILGPFFEKICLKMPTSTIHAVSNSTKQDLINFKVKSNIKVIYNGIDLECYDQLRRQKRLPELYYIYWEISLLQESRNSDNFVWRSRQRIARCKIYYSR